MRCSQGGKGEEQGRLDELFSGRERGGEREVR